MCECELDGEQLEEKIKGCLDFIEAHDNFVLCGHPYPDGDSIGSLVAMGECLTGMGKKCQGVLFSSLPDRYKFLRGSEKLTVFPKGMPNPPGALICLDVGSADRIEKLVDALPDDIPTLNIDHHTSNPGFGTFTWNTSVLSSVGEMTYNIIKASPVALTEVIAEALYVAIVTDTGRFSYRNTRPETLEVCAELLRCGVECASVYENIYESGTHDRLQLLARTLATVETAFDASVSWMVVTQDMYEETGTLMHDSYEFIDLLKSVAGTTVALLFRELEDGRIKMSVRSDGSLSAHDLCAAFGGGGHRCAAGSIMKGDMQGVIDDVVLVLKKMRGLSGVS